MDAKGGKPMRNKKKASNKLVNVNRVGGWMDGWKGVWPNK